MGLLEIILIAIGLSMDAFAVSITLGLSVQNRSSKSELNEVKFKLKQALTAGLYFGFFQGIMPLIGYFAGLKFADRIHNIDHWIAFALLGFIGCKMIKDSFSKEEKKVKENPFLFTTMLLLAIATSIDALAVGITFAFFDVNIWVAIVIVGLITFFISMGGVKIGNVFGTTEARSASSTKLKFKSKAEFIGGLVLIAIGLKILIEHLFFH
jgi:putative Mn2+ efflux pump MntP